MKPRRSWFATDRAQLEAGLARVRRDLCAYTYPAQDDDFCPGDCKYGIGAAPGKGQSPSSSEQTGCPEVSQALAMVRAMTAAQYKLILTRAGGIRLSALEKALSKKGRSGHG